MQRRTLVFLVVAAVTGLAQPWTEVPCPPDKPFTFCTLYDGVGTWTLLDESWVRLGIFIHSGLIEIRDPYTGRITGRITAPRASNFAGGLSAFSPDGRLLATPVDDGTLRVWDVESGRELWALPSSKFGGFAAFSPNGRLLASLGPDGEIVVWDIVTGSRALSLFEFQPIGGVSVIGFSPDGRWLVGLFPWCMGAGAEPRATWASVVWDLSTGHLARFFPGPVMFLPNGQFLRFEVSGALLWGVSFWEGPVGERLRYVRLPWFEDAYPMDVRPDGKYIAFALADGTIRFWEVATGEEVGQLDLLGVLGIAPETGSRLAQLAFSPDGNLVLTVLWTPQQSRRVIHLWHVGGLLGAVSADP